MRNLGYTYRMFNFFSDLIYGNKMTEVMRNERKARQFDKLSMIAPCSNIAVTLSPFAVALILAAEQVYEAMAPVPMKESSYYSGGVLAAWRGGVSPTESLLVLVALTVFRAVCLKLELTIADNLLENPKLSKTSRVRIQSVSGSMHGQDKSFVVDIQTVRCHRKEIKGVMNLVLGGSDPKAAMGLAALATAMTMGTLNEVVAYARVIQAAK